MSRRLGLFLLLPILLGLAVLGWMRGKALVQGQAASPVNAASETTPSVASDSATHPGAATRAAKARGARQEEASFAIGLLERQVEKFPGNAPLRLTLAQAYMHRGFFGLATQSLDSALALDPSLDEAQELRAVAYTGWVKESVGSPPPQLPPETPAAITDTVIELGEGMPRFKETEVILPGSMALLGTYTVGWGASHSEVMRSYPGKRFTETPAGNMRETFVHQGALHENTLAYEESALWGVHVSVKESRESGDLFGHLIRLKTMISGEGRGTGEAQCPDQKPFQGVIWENEDTFEFMAQFRDKPTEVRMVRLNPVNLPQDKRLCSLAKLFSLKVWR